MSSQELVLLRSKVEEAVRVGYVSSEYQDQYFDQYVQLLNEIERKKQACDAGMARLMEQYHAEMGKKQAFTAMASVLLNQIQANIDRTRRAQEIEAELKAAQATPIESEEVPVIEKQPARRTFICNCQQEFRSMTTLSKHRLKCATFKRATGLL